MKHNYEIAGLGARAWAYLIDWHIRVIMALILFVVVLIFNRLNDLHHQIYLFFNQLHQVEDLVKIPEFQIPALCYFIYQPFIEALMKGSSPGKYMAGISIVNIQGDYASFGQHLLRNFVRAIDSFPFCYCIGAYTVLFSRESTRFGDKLSGTRVVYSSSLTSVNTPLDTAS